MLEYPGRMTVVTLALVLGVGNPLLARAAAAATFKADSTLDEVDKTPGDGLCQSRPSGKCTLRAAIQEANALGGKRTIKLPAGTYLLSRAGRGEDKAKTGDLDITSKITIKGAGAATTIIDAGGVDRVFDVHAGMLSINRLTVQGGKSKTDHGGGIYVRAGKLKAKLVRISSNSTHPDVHHPYDGGGIYNRSKVILVQTLLSENSARSGSAIFTSEDARLDVTSSLISDNSSTAAGALWSDGLTFVTNSTLSGNASGTGGGVAASLGSTYLFNDTISSNDGGLGGGGIYNYGAFIFVANTIIEANQGSDTSSCHGTLTSGDYNIVNPKEDGCVIVGQTAHDQYGTGPSLFTLRDDGGFTWTHPLLDGSPAVDGGNPAGCKNGDDVVLTVDQRGRARPVDGDGSGGARCDVGASELQP